MAMPFPPPGGGPMPQMQFPPGQQPSPQQIAAMQQHFAREAAKQGLTPQQFAERLRAVSMAQKAAQAQAQAQGQIPGQAPGQQPLQQGQIPPPGGAGAAGGAAPQGQTQQQMVRPGQQVPIQPGPPKPEALAVAKFLCSQDLKARPCIFQEKRKELFKVKRAIRALRSPAYEKARSKKNSLLPEITDRVSAENVFKLLPISMLALRVSKIDTNPAHGQPGHQHGGGKGKGGKKGLWNVKIEQQQEAADEFHYIWFYEGSQWRQKVYAVGVLLAVVAVVLFPLWPYFLRRGVWYVSMGALGLLGLFFGLAIFRLILFVATVVIGPKPGIWLYPNLFEDVGFFDSFKPVWAWRETKESLALKKAAKKSKKQEKRRRAAGAVTIQTDAEGNRLVEDVTEEVDGDEREGDVTEDVVGEVEGEEEGDGEEGGDMVEEMVGNAVSAATGVSAGEGAVQRRGLHARVEEEDEE